MKKLLLSVFALSAGTAFAQWTEQNTAFSTPTRGILTIDIVDANTVWCRAYDGTGAVDDIFDFTRTTDGGENWTSGTIDLGDGGVLQVNNLSATSGDVAWVSSIDPEAAGGSLYKTEDGGTIWEFIDPTPAGQTTQAYTYGPSFQNVVHFFNPLEGIVQGDPVNAGLIYDFEIYRTVDGGATWSRITPASLPNANDSEEWGYNNGNFGTGNFFWFVTNNGRLFRTADKGVTWTPSQSPLTDFGGANINGRIHFSDIDGDITHAVGLLIGTTNGSATTPTYNRWTTTNGGTTWTDQGVYSYAYQTLDFIPGSSVLVATGNNGTAYTSAYSEDMGATWIEIDSGTQRNAIAFLNGTTGWAGGFNDDETTGGIFKYTGAALGIPTVGERQQFSATPNPTSGMLQVANETASITDVVVYDLLGKQVYKGKFSALNQVNLDLTPLNTGSYILKATSETGATQTIKIMKN